MPQDLLHESKEEIKRADHLLYVTLKYTRTCDVIKNMIIRLINAFDFAIHASLLHIKKKKKRLIIPESTQLRAELFSKFIRKSKEFLKLYFLLKFIDKAEYTTREEYRKHVTLIAIKGPGDYTEVDIEKLRDFFYKTKEFVEFVENYISKKR